MVEHVAISLLGLPALREQVLCPSVQQSVRWQVHALRAAEMGEGARRCDVKGMQPAPSALVDAEPSCCAGYPHTLVRAGRSIGGSGRHSRWQHPAPGRGRAAFRIVRAQPSRVLTAYFRVAPRVASPGCGWRSTHGCARAVPPRRGGTPSRWTREGCGLPPSPSDTLGRTGSTLLAVPRMYQAAGESWPDRENGCHTPRRDIQGSPTVATPCYPLHCERGLTLSGAEGHRFESCIARQLSRGPTATWPVGPLRWWSRPRLKCPECVQ